MGKERNSELIHRITLEEDIASNKTYTRNGETTGGLIPKGKEDL